MKTGEGRLLGSKEAQTKIGEPPQDGWHGKARPPLLGVNQSGQAFILPSSDRRHPLSLSLSRLALDATEDQMTMGRHFIYRDRAAPSPPPYFSPLRNATLHH